MKKTILYLLLLFYCLFAPYCFSQNNMAEIMSQMSEDLIDEAKAGDKEMQFFLGDILWQDANSAKKRGYLALADSCYRESYYWTKKSAQQGYGMGEYSLGMCYFNGEGVSTNYSKALKWFKLAAKQDIGLAWYQIGLCYEQGKGTKKDYTEALKWYLGIIARDSIINDSLGAHLIDLNDGAELAKERLGYMYENGIGVHTNYKMAMKWYESANRFIGHQYNLATKYFQGIIVPQDYKKAFDLFYKSAWPPEFTGYDSSIYMLAFMYEHGLGTSTNISTATKLYRIASQKGIEDAKQRLAQLNAPQIHSITTEIPTFHILSPKNGNSYEGKTIIFEIKTSGDDDIYVEINGSPAIKLSKVTHKGAQASAGNFYIIDNAPSIPNSLLNLVFFTKNTDNIESERKRIVLQCHGAIIKPKLILFAVGISNYKSPDINKLRFAAKDASDFANAVEQTDLDDYSDFTKYIFTDNNATRKKIINGMNSLIQATKAGDIVVFYFSGHGQQDYNETYFMTVNASRENPSEEGINFADIRNTMRKLTERQVKVVAFMDACHAGAMVGAKGAAPKLTELDVQNVIEFYSSTTGEESAEDEKLQNGVFTAGLISGLNGAAANADGYITVNTLRTYLSDYVRNKNSRQTPVFKGVDAGDITLFHKK